MSGRWTTDAGSIVYDEPGFGEVMALVCSRRSGRPVITTEAHLALRQAVIDADTLAKACQIAARLRSRWPAPDGDFGALLDLLTEEPGR